MKVSLPLVQDLKSKAMRDRHWKQLIKLTGATPGTIAVSDERFKLDDLISLGIHKYGEDVVAIVEKANKELQIDAALTKVIHFKFQAHLLTIKYR
jgi:dynein heavy chain, axonemal